MHNLIITVFWAPSTYKIIIHTANFVIQNILYSSTFGHIVRMNLGG